MFFLTKPKVKESDSSGNIFTSAVNGVFNGSRRLPETLPAEYRKLPTVLTMATIFWQYDIKIPACSVGIYRLV